MLAGMMGTSGTPDSYYDFNLDLWVEWKVLSTEDRLPNVIPQGKMPTELQRLWLDRRWRAGRNAVCIIGVKLRNRAFGIVLETPEEWREPPQREWFEPRLRSAKQLAEYITTRVT